MTTSWSHAVRGNFRAATASSGGGTLLFVAAAVAAPWALASAMAGRWVAGRPTPPVLMALGGAWLTVTIIDWARRLAAG